METSTFTYLKKEPPTIEFYKGFQYGIMQTNNGVIRIIDRICFTKFTKSYSDTMFTYSYLNPYEGYYKDYDFTAYTRAFGTYLGLFYPVYILLLIFLLVLYIRTFMQKVIKKSVLRRKTILDEMSVYDKVIDNKKKLEINDNKDDDILRI